MRPAMGGFEMAVLKGQARDDLWRRRANVNAVSGLAFIVSL